MKRRIVFLTREPIAHQLVGSTTFALNLLGLLARQNASVTIVATSAASRSPRLWFRLKTPLPEGVKLFAPGFLRFGNLYLNVLSMKAWARFLSRVGVRVRPLSFLCHVVERLFHGEVYTTAWDLTTPTVAEREVALLAVERRRASTVIVNYACWAPILTEQVMDGRNRVILMHDLLSARVQGFKDAGRPLDCPDIDEATEMSWLERADCVLAAQVREAELIKPKLSCLVLVQPVAFTVRPSLQEPEAWRCLFVGSNIMPNKAGLAWFLQDVWPQVRVVYADATLAVIGTVSASVADGIAGVEKLGMVASLDDEYAKAAVCVVPLQVGSGIKIKLIEALSFGKAVVSTSIGVQGLEDWAPQAVAVADDADLFAQAVIALLSDPSLRKSREEAALALTLEHYSGEKALDPAFVEAVL